jgi:hypothetical protein
MCSLMEFRGNVFYLFTILLSIGMFFAVLDSERAMCESGEREIVTLELLRDGHFQQGFGLLGPDGKGVDILDFGKDDITPAWLMAQWHSQYCLAGTKPSELLPNGIGYKNEGKLVVLAPPGSEYADLILTVKGGAEFDYTPMKAGDAWPHLLVSQELIGRKSLRLDNLSEVNLSIAARLLDVKYYDKQPAGAMARAAHCHIYFTIQNRDYDSGGYGDYYWFGIPIYDTRYLYSPLYAAQDASSEDKPGTGKYIYRPDAREVSDKTLHSGEWVEVNIDMLPFILAGLEDAWAKGYLRDSRDLKDYYISSLNVGWEVWGLVDISIQLRDFSIIAKYYKE